MPFEPLRTDEKLDGPIKREKDLDTQMLTGCTGFVIASVGCFVLTAWPFFALTDVYRASQLGLACLLGFIPATLFGAILTRRFGLPGGSGVVAGALASSVFLLLRMPQVFLAGQLRVEFLPEYPPVVQYLLPAGWLLWCAIATLVLLPKGELPTKDE